MGDEASQRKAVPFRVLPPICRRVFRGRSSGGIIMNTALARRLALGDRVIWMGKDDCQPSGPGTIIRITAHQVEVLWEGETARRYRMRATVQPSTCETHLHDGGPSLRAP